MATFEINKKHGFVFEFIVDGKKEKETIYIDMTDRNLPKRLMNAQKAVDDRIKDIKIKDVEFKSDGIPKNIETFDDVANLSNEQLEDIKNVSDAIFDFYDESEKAIIDEIGKALGTDVSPCFKHCSAFDVIDEQYYVALFLERLADDMVKYLKEHPQQEINIDKKSYMRKYLKK